MEEFIFDLQRFDNDPITVTVGTESVTISYDSSISAYKIDSVKTLQALAIYVNSGTEDDPHTCNGLTFKVTAKIDLSSIDNWTPIGKVEIAGDCSTYSYPFKGTFDGGSSDGYTISGLTINKSDTNNVGLFGQNNDGTIRNVNLTNVNISGNNKVGGVVGNNNSSESISGNSNSGAVSGNVTGTGNNNLNVGGIVGETTGNGNIENNTNVGTISGTGGTSSVGIVVGFRDSGTTTTVSGNYYYKSSNDMLNDVGNGDTGSSTQVYKLTLPAGATVTNGAQYTETDTTTNAVYAYVTSSATVTFTYDDSDYLKVDDKFIDKQNGTFSLTLTLTDDAEVDTFLTKDPSDTTGKIYLITSAEDLQTLSALVNGTYNATTKQYENAHDCDGLTFNLDANINMSGKDFTPIGCSNGDPDSESTAKAPFKGTFDGDGDDTLTGGGGNDKFIWTAGDDEITDYAEGDKISLGSGALELENISVNGKNVEIELDGGSLTIDNALGKKISVKDDDSSHKYIFDKFAAYNEEKTSATLLSATDSFTAPDKVKVIDGSLTEAVTIYGNGLNNSIVGSSGNDTLAGGKGDDSLWGDDGADTFIYGDGNDIIFGFGNDDTLTANGFAAADILPVYDSENNSVTVKLGTGSVTFKDFTATKFNIGDTTWQLSGSTLTKK